MTRRCVIAALAASLGTISGCVPALEHLDSELAGAASPVATWADLRAWPLEIGAVVDGTLDVGAVPLDFPEGRSWCALYAVQPTTQPHSIVIRDDVYRGYAARLVVEVLDAGRRRTRQLGWDDFHKPGLAGVHRLYITPRPGERYLLVHVDRAYDGEFAWMYTTMTAGHMSNGIYIPGYPMSHDVYWGPIGAYRIKVYREATYGEP